MDVKRKEILGGRLMHVVAGFEVNKPLFHPIKA